MIQKESGMITNPDVFLGLNLIDWGRYSPWRHSGEAMESVLAWVTDAMHYTVVPANLTLAPAE